MSTNSQGQSTEALPTGQSLPDHLAPGLDIVFVGINPGLYSAQVGHYFATPRNRSWKALNASGLVGASVGPGEDSALLQYGIGFTDLVKRSTRNASQLNTQDFKDGALVLQDKLLRYQPLIAAFHGVTAYGNYRRHVEGKGEHQGLGLQSPRIGSSHVFVTPNPSPANAVYSLDNLIQWYRQLRELRDRLRREHA